MVRIGNAVFHDCGVAPAEFLELFASRRAFIYVLEILAQVLALVTLAGRLPQRWLAFIDRRRPMGRHKGIRKGRRR